MPSPVAALTAKTSAPTASACAAAARSGTSIAMSAFVSRTTGVAPDCHAIARQRCNSRGRGRPTSGATTNTVSTFAATICETVCRLLLDRSNVDRRGRTAMATVPSRATQSPTAGVPTGSPGLASCSNSRPEGRTRIAAEPVSTVNTPRSTRATRAGVSSMPRADDSAATSSAREASQPSKAKDGEARVSSDAEEKGSDDESKDIERSCEVRWALGMALGDTEREGGVHNDEDGHSGHLLSHSVIREQYCLLYTSPSPRDRQKSR